MDLSTDGRKLDKICFVGVLSLNDNYHGLLHYLYFSFLTHAHAHQCTDLQAHRCGHIDMGTHTHTHTQEHIYLGFLHERRRNTENVFAL